MAERRKANPRGGFTLVELAIGLMLSMGMLLVVGFSTDRALGMFRQRRA
jgi:Tfp pilus assembly protein PilW